MTKISFLDLSANLSNLHSIYRREKFEAKRFFQKICVCSIIFCQKPKLFRRFVKELSAETSKLYSTCLEQLFEEKHCFWKIWSFINIYEKKLRFPAVWWIFPQVCQTCILFIARWICMAKICSQKNGFFSLSDIVKKNFSLFEKTFPAEISMLGQITSPEENFMKEYFK